VHTRQVAAAVNLGDVVPEATAVFAVFRQDSKVDPHVHAGDVHAPDPEMALVLAKEQFARRDPCVNLWVVRCTDITATRYEDADLFAPATALLEEMTSVWRTDPAARW